MIHDSWTFVPRLQPYLIVGKCLTGRVTSRFQFDHCFSSKPLHGHEHIVRFPHVSIEEILKQLELQPFDEPFISL